MPAVLAVDLTILHGRPFSPFGEGGRKQFMQAKQGDDSHEGKSCGEVIVKVSPIAAHIGYRAKMRKTCFRHIACFVRFCGKEPTLA